MSLYDLLAWFAGGSRPYMTLYHCMSMDLPWVALTVGLDLAVASGYLVIALHWWRNQRGTRITAAQRALANMKNIFVFCGLCGYVFIPVKMFWPAWRLYDMFLAVLAFYTWRYAWSARELKVVYNELTRSERLAEHVEELKEESRQKSRFLNSIGHDLRTPLNGILLQAQVAEMAAEGMDPGSEDARALRDALESIKANTRATAELLDNFVEIGRLDWGTEAAEDTCFRLDELVARVADGARTAAGEKGLYVRWECPEGLTVRSDRAKLERVLKNLAGNGVKFTCEGGVELTATTSGGDVEVRVTDTGVGIDAEHLPRLFDEFYQVHNDERDRRKGYGLGLAVAQRLARKLGGDLGVESTPGAGSRFIVRLPGVVTHAPDGPRAAAPHRGG